MDDYEWEEETTYVAFDLGKNVTSEFVDTVSRVEGGCRIIGLAEGEPYLQLGELIFQGQVDETIGSHLYFEIEERKSETTGLLPLLTSIRADTEEASKPQRYTATYKFSTETLVNLEPVTLTRKKRQAPTEQQQQQQQEDDDEPMLL